MRGCFYWDKLKKHICEPIPDSARLSRYQPWGGINTASAQDRKYTGAPWLPCADCNMQNGECCPFLSVTPVKRWDLVERGQGAVRLGSDAPHLLRTMKCQAHVCGCEGTAGPGANLGSLVSGGLLCATSLPLWPQVMHWVLLF